jgi:16S rRNA (adenine1518-N6/adenine1519-N6)-dimethyltransferase
MPGVQKKKSLGQHFLNSRHYLTAVADAADIQKGDLVVEIGPGEGSLTSVLVERGATVLALEKDTRLIPVLREKFLKGVEVIEIDALEFDVRALKGKSYKVVGNIPYYITGALLRKFLTISPQPETLVFLMQKEVAQRIARSKKESILSLSIKAYGTPLYIKSVPRGAFAPPPNVDSALVKVADISRDHFTSAAHEARFFELVKKGFSSKRKKLSGNLGKEYASIFAEIGLDPNVRAEDVPLNVWLALSLK